MKKQKIEFDTTYQQDETVRGKVMNQVCAVYGCDKKPTSSMYCTIDAIVDLEIYVMLCDKHRKRYYADDNPRYNMAIRLNRLEDRIEGLVKTREEQD